MPAVVESDSEFTHKGACDDCGSSDANAHYTDGHTHCFACGHHTRGDGDATPRERRRRVAGLIENAEIRGIRSRKLTDETCKHFGYGFGSTKKYGEVQIAPYYDADGNLVAQHLRAAGKEFPWLGEPKDAMPFGYHAFPKSGKMLVLTEGEIDAMSMSQVQGNKWPVWSIGCGADQPFDKDGRPLPLNKIRKYIAKHRDAFLRFEKIVLMFDGDEQGRASARVASEVIGPTAWIAELPLKDASDMLKEGRTEELLKAMWNPVKHRPDGIVDLKSLREEAINGVAPGLSWPWPIMSEVTAGRHTGEVYCFGAGTGVGKTEALTEIIEHTAFTLDRAIGVFFLEQAPRETVLRLAGKRAGRRFHIPNSGWQQAELAPAVDEVIASKNIHLYDSFGLCEWPTIADRIRYLRHAEGVRHFLVDHLTALASGADDERKELEQVMAAIASLAKELDVEIIIVSHLATPEGKPHEEGGRVMIRHLKGSRAIGFWCFKIYGLERDQQARDERLRSTITLRELKNRRTGNTGVICGLWMNPSTGRLEQVTAEEIAGKAADRHGFKDESEGGSDGDGDF